MIARDDELARALRSRTVQTLWLSVGYLGYMLLIWVWIARTISRPLERLSAGARAACDSDREARLATTGPREVVQLANSFSCLVESLEGRVRDRTLHLEEANTRLEIARADAELANRTKSAFLANMGHEMRTPMHGILSFAGLGIESAQEGSP